MVNSSPYLTDDDFDHRQLDTSMKVEIELKAFKVKLQQDTLISMFDILANNISFDDEFSRHFKTTLVIEADATEAQRK